MRVDYLETNRFLGFGLLLPRISILRSKALKTEYNDPSVGLPVTDVSL